MQGHIEMCMGVCIYIYRYIRNPYLCMFRIEGPPNTYLVSRCSNGVILRVPALDPLGGSVPTLAT